MKIKIGFIYILVLCFTINIQAQYRGPAISFAKKEYDFGKINEYGGAVSIEFEFTNVGSEPLIIQNVRASCGCTTPNWSKEPVMPGNNGFVTATFDPMGRTGVFHKTISVATNAEPPDYELIISGEVIPKEKDITELYPKQIGNLRLSDSEIPFARIKNTAIVTGGIEVVNIGTTDLAIDFANKPNFLEIKALPPILKPKQKGYIEVKYDAKRKNDWDYVLDYFNLQLNDKVFSNEPISVSATIQEDFSKLDKKSLDEAPKVEFNQTSFNFGNVKIGTKVVCEFYFTNNGKDDLVIRKVRPSCSCVINNEIVGRSLDGGKTNTLKITYDTSNKKAGADARSIIVVTNDPKNPRIILKITGILE